VRCLFPDAHANGDRTPGSAYLIRRGEIQLYGCAVCGGGRAMDTIALIRRVYPALDFPGALAVCHEIDFDFLLGVPRPTIRSPGASVGDRSRDLGTATAARSARW
jgi:hypothetical protein